MNCPKCKNPIEDSATVCEWCGEKITSNVDSQTTTNNFYNEIQNLLNGKISYNGKIGMVAAIPYTQNKYSCDKVEACYRIDKCMYFSANPNANLSNWKWHCLNKRNKLRLIDFLLAITIIGMPAAIIIGKQESMFNKYIKLTDIASCNTD